MIEMPADADDLEAIRAVLSGDKDAFRRLVEKYERSIFNLAYRMSGNAADAEELAQEAFLRAFSRLASFRVGMRFHPWLYTIAINLCRNHLRRRSLLRWVSLGARQSEADPAAPDPVERSLDPEQALLDREGDERLQRALDALPPKYREVFLLRQSEGLSYGEIARVTGLPLGTVEARLFRARRLLLSALKGPDAPRRPK